MSTVERHNSLFQVPFHPFLLVKITGGTSDLQTHPFSGRRKNRVLVGPTSVYRRFLEVWTQGPYWRFYTVPLWFVRTSYEVGTSYPTLNLHHVNFLSFSYCSLVIHLLVSFVVFDHYRFVRISVIGLLSQTPKQQLLVPPLVPRGDTSRGVSSVGTRAPTPSRSEVRGTPTTSANPGGGGGGRVFIEPNDCTSLLDLTFTR